MFRRRCLKQQNRTGHYFALLTLATRDFTGGSLGYTPERYNGGSSIYAVQFLGKETWYLIALGIYVPLARALGAAITILLTETLRISFGTAAVGWDNLVYGTLLVLFIIFLPQGLLGSLLAMLTRREVVRHD